LQKASPPGFAFVKGLKLTIQYPTTETPYAAESFIIESRVQIINANDVCGAAGKKDEDILVLAIAYVEGQLVEERLAPGIAYPGEFERLDMLESFLCCDEVNERDAKKYRLRDREI
jgi:hypothetical protein